MFKNALVYRIEAWEPPPLPEIDARLAAACFVECSPSQSESAGWVAPRGEQHAAFAESVGGQVVLKLCTETKAVPGSVVKTQIEEKLATIERDTGRRPRGKIVKELKEEVIHALLPRAFPKRSETRIWIDPSAQFVLVGASSAKKADKIVTRLVEALGGGLKLSLLQTTVAPATAMSSWLIDKEAPAGFTIDRDCELKQPDSEKAAVRYARHTLDIDEVGEHIREGKLPTQLALTWSGRVSFVLTEALTLKRIQLLDVALEGAGAATGKDEGGFDADVALMTGELQRLLPDLVQALGGEQRRDTAAPVVPAVASPVVIAGRGAAVGADGAAQRTVAEAAGAAGAARPGAPGSTSGARSAGAPGVAPWDTVPA